MIVGPSEIVVTSSCVMRTKGECVIVSVIICEKPCRSTARALPAGTACVSAAFITKESKMRNSSFNIPTAFCIEFERKELEQTNSANCDV